MKLGDLLNVFRALRLQHFFSWGWLVHRLIQSDIAHNVPRCWAQINNKLFNYEQLSKSVSLIKMFTGIFWIMLNWTKNYQRMPWKKIFLLEDQKSSKKAMDLVILGVE